MSDAVDFNKMRKELIWLYEEFLRNPENDILHENIVAYELQYGGLQVYNDYLKSQPVPKDIETALGGLSTIYQYGLWEDTHEAFSDEKIVNEAKKILEDLKKSE